MNSIITILLIIIAFWSIITTFKAIYSILTKQFKGSKLTWILISMIAIIGPIIWIVKGRKLLIERHQEPKINL